MAVKLGQSLDTIYNLEFLEYSLYCNIVKKEIEEKNKQSQEESGTTNIIPEPPALKVNLPDHLKLK